MQILKIGVVGALALMLSAPVQAQADGIGESFNNFGHSVASGAKQAGHAVKHGARRVGRSFVLGWHSFKHNLDDGR